MNQCRPLLFRARRFSVALLRAVVVAMTALAWLFPSVQCSMGCAVPLGSPLPSCCAPAAHDGTTAVCVFGSVKDSDDGSDLCREVAAELSSDGSEKIVPAPVVLSLSEFGAPLSTPVEETAFLAPAVSPPAWSFAERVLQESLFAHAPPHSR